MIDTVTFLKADNPRALFPLRSNLLFIEAGEAAIRKFVEGEILNRKEGKEKFLPCPPVYALKDHIHLRRTLALDPIALWFIYNFVTTHSEHFSARPSADRQMYGYAFGKNGPIDSFADYHNFRRRKYKLKEQYKYFAKVDIANCFNSFYHHDIVESIESRIGISAAQEMGMFLREINSGTSIDFFPQGIYPTKAIGNWFLDFIEQSQQLNCSAIIRFLDDIYLFSDRRSTVESDVLQLQHILGNHALSLNPDKTRFGSFSDDFEDKNIDDIKLGLLKKRAKRVHYVTDDEDEEEDDEDTETALNDEEREYLKSLIGARGVGEEDVELALSLLRDDVDAQMLLVEIVLDHFPHLMKSLHGMIQTIPNNGPELWSLIESRLRRRIMTSFELFWMVRIAVDYFTIDATVASTLIRIHDHQMSDPIVKAAVLEETAMANGLEEFKITALRNNPGSFQSAAAIAGLKDMGKGKRNQIYKYVSSTNRHMSILCDIMCAL